MKVTKKTVVSIRNIGEFYIEAEYNTSDNSIDFWLCRDGYAKKVGLFGVPAAGINDAKNLFEFFENLWTDIEYMECFYLDLLDEDEELEDAI